MRTGATRAHGRRREIFDVHDAAKGASSPRGGTDSTGSRPAPSLARNAIGGEDARRRRSLHERGREVKMDPVTRGRSPAARVVTPGRCAGAGGEQRGVGQDPRSDIDDVQRRCLRPQSSELRPHARHDLFAVEVRLHAVRMQFDDRTTVPRRHARASSSSRL